MRILQLFSVALLVSVAHTSPMLRQMGAVGARTRVLMATSHARFCDQVRKTQSKISLKVAYLLGKGEFINYINREEAKRVLEFSKKVKAFKDNNLATKYYPDILKVYYEAAEVIQKMKQAAEVIEEMEQNYMVPISPYSYTLSHQLGQSNQFKKDLIWEREIATINLARAHHPGIDEHLLKIIKAHKEEE